MISTPKIYKMRIVFTFPDGKEHKHIFNTVRKMIMDSGLPFEPAKVNKNWPRFAYGPSVGYAQLADCEYADLYFCQPVTEKEVAEKLKKVAPKEFTILKLQRVPFPLPSVQHLAEEAVYRIEGDFSVYSPKQSLSSFLGGRKIEISRCASNGFTCLFDAKPFLANYEQVNPQEIRITLKKVEDKWLKPEVLLAAWLEVPVPAEDECFTLENLTFIREGLFWRDTQGNTYPI